MIPMLDYHQLAEARFQFERRAFARRHCKFPIVWAMFCIGFALGVILMLVTR